jgi:hypothetical protein
MENTGDETWKIKRDNTTYRLMKLQEALGRMDEFDAQMESGIDKLKALARGTKTLTKDVLGALREERTQHEYNTTTKGRPMPLKKKGKVVECYFCSHNHLVRDFPM